MAKPTSTEGNGHRISVSAPAESVLAKHEGRYTPQEAPTASHPSDVGSEQNPTGLFFASPLFRSYETIITESGSVPRKRLSLTCPTPATFSAATIAAFR